ncbi:unnamed protein product, partial [Bubo scandiacus]
GNSVRSPSPEEEGTTETCDELTAFTHPLTPCAAGGGEVEKSGAKLSLGRRERRGEGFCKMWLYFPLSHSVLLVN